jgi:class 3 adenylate cyclase
MASATRGYLFADPRGYTKLVDTRGAVEASRLLERYRTITREVVARFGGAEIRTQWLLLASVTRPRLADVQAWWAVSAPGLVGPSRSAGPSTNP